MRSLCYGLTDDDTVQTQEAFGNNTNIAKADKYAFSTDIDNGGILTVEVLPVTKSGKAGMEGVYNDIDPGDLKFNLILEWPDEKNSQHQEDCVVDVELEFNTGGKKIVQGSQDPHTYHLDGSVFNVQIPNKYYGHSQSNGMQLKSMESGYPRLETSDDRAVFTLRFQKSNSIFYDPTFDIGKGTCVYRQSSGNKYSFRATFKDLVTQMFSSNHEKMANAIASKLEKLANGVEGLTFDKNTIGKYKEAITYPNGGMLLYRVATDNGARAKIPGITLSKGEYWVESYSIQISQDLDPDEQVKLKEKLRSDLANYPSFRGKINYYEKNFWESERKRDETSHDQITRSPNYNDNFNHHHYAYEHFKINEDAKSLSDKLYGMTTTSRVHIHVQRSNENAYHVEHPDGNFLLYRNFKEQSTVTVPNGSLSSEQSMFEVYFVHVREDLNERERKEAKDGLTTELNRYNGCSTLTFLDDYFGCPENNSNKISESEVGPNQFQVNGVIIDLPKDPKEGEIITREVAEATCQLLLDVARNGVGETTAAKGMLIVVGSEERMKEVGYCDKNKINKFDSKDVSILDWEKAERDIKPCFIQDEALFIDGKTGRIMAEMYKIDLLTRNADQNGGTGHKSASAVGAEGCLAIKCPEDSCTIDGTGKGVLKIFSGSKEPAVVPIQSVENVTTDTMKPFWTSSIFIFFVLPFICASFFSVYFSSQQFQNRSPEIKSEVGTFGKTAPSQIQLPLENKNPSTQSKFVQTLLNARWSSIH